MADALMLLSLIIMGLFISLFIKDVLYSDRR